MRECIALYYDSTTERCFYLHSNSNLDAQYRTAVAGTFVLVSIVQFPC